MSLTGWRSSKNGCDCLMCGFAGFINPVVSQSGNESILRSMGDTIRHRGPDDTGVWIDESDQVGLVHTRLSIVDLSPAIKNLFIKK